MDLSFQEESGAEEKKTRRTSLMKSLSKLRVADRADVKIVCGERQFLAHSLVLEASSVYFKTMLNSKMEEAKVRKVIFNEIEPTSIDVILDFLYLGDVEQMETMEEVTNVLRAAHLMQLDQLVDYCWDVFTASMSVKNFDKILEIAAEFGNRDMTAKVYNYIIANLSDITVGPEFCSLSSETLQPFLVFAKTKRLCVDKLLEGLCRWMLDNLEARKPLLHNMLDTIDTKLLSESCIKSLPKWKELKDSLVEVRELLKDLASTTDLSIIYGPFKTSFCIKTRLVFLSEYRRKEVFDPVNDCRVMRNVQQNSVQQFDLDNGTWLPVQDLTFTGYRGAAICHHNTQLYLAGGKLCPAYVMFDPDTNVVDHPGYGHGVNAFNAGLCFYKDHLYIIGGSSEDGEQANNQVLFVSIGSATWHTSTGMVHKRSYPTVLTSADHIYVGGGTNYPARFTVEFSTGCKDKLQWELLYIPHLPSRAVGLRCFVVNSTLHGLYYVNGELIHMKHDREVNKLVTKKSVFGLPGITSVFSPSAACEKVFVATSAGLQIPQYIWDPEEDNWLMLDDSVKGSRFLPQDKPVHTVCTTYT